jgi:hypothetical protein
MSTRDAVRKAKPKVHACEISGGTVHVRALSSGGRSAYLALVTKHKPDSPPTHEIVALGLCENDGAPSYDPASEKDMAELRELDGVDAEKVALKIFEVSGLTKDAAEAAEKNS